MIAPGIKKERAELIDALRFALGFLGSDVGRPPRDRVEGDGTHEPHQVGPTIIPVAIGSEQNGRTAEIPTPIGNGPVTFAHVVDRAILNHDDAEGDSLFTNTSKLNF